MSADTKKIIVCSPKIYNISLCNVLIKYEYEVEPFPTIETNLIINSQFLALFSTIEIYDYVVLPSRNAIKSFFVNAENLNFDLKSFNTCNFVTIGNDALFLENYGYNSSLTNALPSTKGIFDALVNKKDKIKKIALLKPRVEIISEPDIIPDFIRNLTTLCSVDTFDAYITRPVKNVNSSVIKAIKNKKYEYVLFTSGAEVEALIFLLGNVNFLRNMKIVCFGPFTASAATKLGLTPFYIGKNYSSFENFVKELNENKILTI
jgi:uroporphyrinogen-III synthase